MAEKQPDILDFDIEHERKPLNREGNHGYYYCDLLNSEHGGSTYECNCGLPEAIAAHEALLVQKKTMWDNWETQVRRGETAKVALEAICNEAIVWTTEEIVAEAKKALAEIEDGTDG